MTGLPHRTSEPITDIVTPEPPSPELSPTPPPVPEKTTARQSLPRSHRERNLSLYTIPCTTQQRRSESPVPAARSECAAVGVVQGPLRSPSMKGRPTTPDRETLPPSTRARFNAVSLDPALPTEEDLPARGHRTPDDHTTPPLRKRFIPAVRPPTGPSLASVTAATGQEASIAQAMAGLQMPWLKANGGSGEQSNDATKKCPEAPRPLRTRHSPHCESLQTPSYPDSSSPLRHEIHSDDVLRYSPKPETDSYPQPVELSGTHFSSSAAVSGSYADLSEQVARLMEEKRNRDEDRDAAIALYEAENERLRAALNAFNEAEKDGPHALLEAENMRLKERIKTLENGPENSVPSGLINTPTYFLENGPTCSRSTPDRFFREAPSGSKNKRQSQGDFDIADFGTEMRTGMSKMVKGIIDLTIKGGKCLSPKHLSGTQGEPLGVVPNEYWDGGAPRQGPVGVELSAPGGTSSTTAIPGSEHGPASRTRSKTSPTLIDLSRAISAVSMMPGSGEALSSQTSASGRQSSASSIRSHKQAPPPRKSGTGQRTRKRSSATIDAFGTSGAPTLGRKSTSSSGRLRQNHGNVAPSRRSQRLQSSHQSE